MRRPLSGEAGPIVGQRRQDADFVMTLKISDTLPEIAPVGETPAPASPVRLHPSAVRHIRLGAGSKFAEACIKGGYVGLSFKEQAHEACTAGDWSAIAVGLRSLGEKLGTVTSHVREIQDFYTLGADALWITFWQGKLWWAFAEPDVAWHADQYDALPRQRRTLGAWRCADLQGKTLWMRELGTRFTQVEMYRGTICQVKEQDYLLRRLHGEKEPLVIEAEALQASMIDMAGRLISALHWRDFELLVDRIFADAGWRRVSVLGETMADADLLIEQRATGERAFVQVKSSATPAVLNKYVACFEKDWPDCDRMIFVCHSPSRPLAARANDKIPDVDLWFGDTLARKAVEAGLLGWLIDRAR